MYSSGASKHILAMACVNHGIQNAGTVVHDMLVKVKPKDFDRGVQLPVSGPSHVRSSILFRNETGNPVMIIWINYEGRLINYITLSNKRGFICNTFMGHPWVAINSVTGAQCQIDGKYVFVPYKPQTTPERFKALITMPVLTLYQYSLLKAVRSMNSFQALNDPEMLCDLPRRLAEDIREAIRKNIFTAKHEISAFPFHIWFDLGILSI